MENQGLNVTVKSALMAMVAVIGLTFASVGTADMGGGVGDGGGNVMKDDPPGANIVRDWLDKAKEPTRYALHMLEMQLEIIERDGNVAPPMRSLLQILFKGPKTVYRVLEDVKFDLVPHGGCEGVDTPLEKDANSMKHPGSICFSLENISAKLGEHFGTTQLIALIIHEISHPVGASEDQANYVQRWVQGYVSSAAFVVASERASEFRMSVASLLNMVEPYGEHLDHLCQTLPYMATDTMELASKITVTLANLGILIPTVKSMENIVAVEMKVLNLTFACPGPMIHPSQVNPDKLFAGKNETTVKAFMEAMGLPSDQTMTLRRVSPDRTEATRQEIQDIVRLLKSVRE